MIYNRSILQKALASGDNPAPLGNRATGRTTAAVLAAIAKAYSEPGCKQFVNDPSCPDGYSARRMLKDKAEAIVALLGLEGFVVEYYDSRVTITNNWTVSL